MPNTRRRPLKDKFEKCAIVVFNYDFSKYSSTSVNQIMNKYTYLWQFGQLVA